jgi:zinc transport system ATP-binding protein
MEYAVRIQDLNVRFNDLTVFENLSVSIPKGQVTSVIGPNGAGKTTLIHALLGFVAYEGKIDFCKPREHIRMGYVPQRLSVPPDMPATVWELFAAYLERRPIFLGPTRRLRRTVAAALSSVGLDNYEDRKIVSLSGGELQRVLLAVSLSHLPDIMLLDEPAAGIDIAAGDLLDTLLLSLARDRGITVVMISHDLNAVNRASDHVICLNRGILCEGPPEHALTPETLARLFGNPAIYATHRCHRGLC